MYPVIYDSTTWNIRSYDVVLCLAIVTGMILVWRDARKKGYPAGRLVICLSGTLICAILGARINGWLFWFQGDPDMLSLNLISTKSGMTAFGGLAGAFGFSALYAYLNRWNAVRLLDSIAPVFALAEGIQRTGCFLNGCCYGHETGSFLGFSQPDALGHWANRYPTQIITGIFCIILYIWLKRQSKDKSFEGSILLNYLVVYNIGRVIIDFLRGDEPLALGLLTTHQLTAAIIAVIAAVVLYFRLSKPAKNPVPVELDNNLKNRSG